MKKLIVTFLVAIVSYIVVADDVAPEKTKRKHTPEQIRSVIKRVNMKKYGGKVRKANSARGEFLVLNAQKTVAATAFTTAVEAIDKNIHVQILVKEAESITAATIRESLTRQGGVLGVALVEDETAPTLLMAPEDGWAIINVIALSKDKPDAKRLASRIRKEILRAFAFLGGGAYAAYGDFVMRDVNSLRDLDAMNHEAYGVALLNLFPNTLPHYGIVPWYETTYHKACQEGWAPAPTNEYQKAIWDKVHATPKTPMKIEFDPKKGR